MAWFRRRRAEDAEQSSDASTTEPAPIAEVVRQGVMIAEVSVRMVAKNFIIINAMGDQLSYNEATVMDAVRAELKSLATEKHEDAERISADAATKPRKRTVWMRRDENRATQQVLNVRRQEVYELLSAELTRLRDDEGYVRATAEKARQDAWLEISRSFEIMLVNEQKRRVRDESYWHRRDDRITYLIEKDLAKLERQSAHKRRAAEESSAAKR
ncbi:hypothetical protein GCM10022198_13740 [Klugiella xanthotipulae]|uniref:Asparagine synthase n=1 Tax=Klugiella xanthotipulae TaxID=244735 RepID=A0A543I4I7_9MICO|nr:hypothetical protein [Klugiella xanthotipulae]TQM65461.1 hypothetical protein FB466_0263 [Klugiella xanthotipulae]